MINKRMQTIQKNISLLTLEDNFNLGKAYAYLVFSDHIRTVYTSHAMSPGDLKEWIERYRFQIKKESNFNPANENQKKYIEGIKDGALKIVTAIDCMTSPIDQAEKIYEDAVKIEQDISNRFND